MHVLTEACALGIPLGVNQKDLSIRKGVADVVDYIFQ